MDKQLEHLLKNNARKFRYLRDSLKLLQEPAPANSGLTIGGELFLVHAGVAPVLASSILWVNPELDVDTHQDKTLRMWPFPLQVKDVECVEKLHAEMFTEGWAAKIRSEGWSTLSDIMDTIRQTSERSILYFVVVDGPPSCIEELRTWDWYTKGRLAIVFQSNGEYVYQDCNCATPIGVRTLHPGNFGYFMAWLRRFRAAGDRAVRVYVGFEYPPSSERLWAAFAQDCSPASLLCIRSFCDMMHRRYTGLMRETIASPVDRLWSECAGFSHDDIVTGKADAMLREFIGISSDDTWPGNLTDADVRSSAMTLCGQTCNFLKNDGRRLSLLGGLLIFLGAVAARAGRWQKLLKVVISTDGSTNEGIRILPPQDSRTAKLSAQSLYNLFDRLVWHKHKNQLAPSSVSLGGGQMEIVFDFDPLSGQGGESSLACAINRAFTDRIGTTPNPSNVRPKTSQAVLDFWLMSNLSDLASTTQVAKEGVFFPPGCGLELETKASRLLLRITQCPT